MAARAVEGEVAEADGVEELEALDDLALEAVGDDAVAAGEVHGAGRRRGRARGEGGEVGDGEAVGSVGFRRRSIPHLRIEMWGTRTRSFYRFPDLVAGMGRVTARDSGRRRRPLQTGAGGRGHVLHHVLAVALGFGVFEVGAEVVEDAVEAGAAGFVAVGAVEEEVLLLGGEVLEGLLDVDLVLVGGELDEAEEVGGAAAGAHGSVEEGLGPVGDGLGGVEVVDAAEAVALGAGAVVGVEGEAAGFEAGDVDAAVGAGHGGGVEGLVHAVDGDEDEAVGHLEGFGDGGFEAAGVVFGFGGASPVRVDGAGRCRRCRRRAGA